jgi:ribosomal protein S18 acetylase RimI-like enzyme
MIRRNKSFPDVGHACAAALLRAGLSIFQDGEYTGRKRSDGPWPRSRSLRQAHQAHRTFPRQMKISRLDSIVDGFRTTHLIACGKDGDAFAFLGTVELLVLRVLVKGVIEARRSACIKALFVHPSFRRQNIGRELVEECCDIAAAFGCETLGLSLAADNREAMAFYEKLGFTFAYEYDDGSAIVSTKLRPVDPET